MQNVYSNTTESLSPKDFAGALGVSESSVKRWVDDGKIRALKTPGGHRRIAVADALHFVRLTGADIARPELLGLKELREFQIRNARPTSDAERADALFDALVEGRATDARALVLSAFVGGLGVAEIADGPLRSALTRIGELWRHDSGGVFVEHRATALVIEALGRLRTLLATPDDSPRAVGCAPSADPYLVPTLAAATALTAEGFNAVNLGPETPLRSLELALDAIKPRLAWLSVSTDPGSTEVLAGIEQLASHARELGASLAIGGRALESRAVKLPTSVVRCRTLTELVAFARGLLRADSGA